MMPRPPPARAPWAALRVVLVGLLLWAVPAAEVQPGAATVALLRPDGESFRAAEAGVLAGLAGRPVERLVVETPAPGELAAWLRAQRPALVLVMDNRHLEALLAIEDPALRRLPVVALLALNLATRLAEEPRACGVAFEPAPWSLINGLQTGMTRPVRRVLAPHRGSVHGAALTAAVRQLGRQGIVLEPLDLEIVATTEAGRRRWLERRLPRLAREADAVLVPADDQLVNQDSISAWAQAADASHRPFVAGWGSLVRGPRGFVTHAGEAEPQALGEQAAQLVHGISAGRSPAEIGVEPPLVVTPLWNPRQRAHLELHDPHAGGTP